ncbi:MAG: glucose-6-phosphate dehydrogenase [Simkaniaceae bacterium]|nr:glucose-6-phosphate dehydrogenase [Simkaniaceae bacterium]
MEENPFQEIGHGDRTVKPCILVIFGATGDLTARKLVPAIYNLKREGQLPSHFACVGFARREKTHDQFRDEMEKGINSFSRVKPVDKDLWSNFHEQLYYHQSEFSEDDGYQSLKKFLEELDEKLGTQGNRVFYLSTQPSFFPTIIEKLKKNGLIYNTDDERFSRVIIEKPFGHNLTSAKELQTDLMQHLDEQQLYRIDHYLGKETVQNLLVFRFGNSLFENMWNNRYIDHVQITVAENIGIGTRGRFYEESGLLRDIIQNHMMQLLSLVAMEPPVNLTAEAIRDEKVKVLQSISPFNEKTFESHAVRGQYGPGFIEGEACKGYREEENVDPKSQIETYAALKLYVQNWRWAGVPFYLRGAKRMPKRVTEISVRFKDAPGILFHQPGQKNRPNVLAIRIQPNEGIALRMNCKVPGPSSPIQPVTMDFRYGQFFGMAPPEAYERLICDCMIGDNTLFTREDEVFNSWRILSPLLEYWENNVPDDFPNYQAGTWGPESAVELLARHKRKWRLL